MLFAGILIALLTISASTRDVGRITKASDEDLAEATYLGGYVLLVGGQFSSMETWTPTAANGPQYNPLPTNSDLEGSRAAVLESRLFSCGGLGSDAMKYCFSTEEGEPDWKPAPSLQVGRWLHSLTEVDGSLVAAGGVDEDGLSSVEILGETGWSTASWSLKAPVRDHCAVSYQGELVILGGWVGSRIRLLLSSEVTSYNIRTGERRSLPNLPYGVNAHACAIFNSTITISGGYTDNDDTDKVWQLVNNKWVELPSIRKERYGHAMGVLGGQLFVLGGYRDGSWDKRSVERLTADGWEEVEQGLQGDFAEGGAIFIE